jgi:ribosomal protein S6--L-glutamate ligase
MPPRTPDAKGARHARAGTRRRGREGRQRVVVLSRNRKLYSTRRLVEAGRSRGHAVDVLDTLRCNLVLARDAPRIFYRGEEVTGVTVVVPRIGASVTGYGLSVVNQFDMMGVPVLNNSIPIARARDKLRALQLLSRFGIDIPRTVMCRYREEVPLAVEQVGGLPCIMKLLQGTQGVGVLIASTMTEVEGMLDTLWHLGQEILIQELIAESRGKDVRALVVGDRVLAAMRRTAPEGEFRSNIHRGGEGQALDLPPAYAAVAVKAVRVIGLEVAGVDMLESRDGPKIMEVNSSPGFEGLERVTGIDVAGPYLEHALEFARAQAAGFEKTRLIERSAPGARPAHTPPACPALPARPVLWEYPRPWLPARRPLPSPSCCTATSSIPGAGSRSGASPPPPTSFTVGSRCRTRRCRGAGSRARPPPASGAAARAS